MHKTTFTALIVLLTSLALSAGAQEEQQEDPIDARGFTPERAFLAGDVDFIDQFSGNLVLAIPIGSSYPVSGNLSYQLTLGFNANYWTDVSQESLEKREQEYREIWTDQLDWSQPWCCCPVAKAHN